MGGGGREGSSQSWTGRVWHARSTVWTGASCSNVGYVSDHCAKTCKSWQLTNPIYKCTEVQDYWFLRVQEYILHKDVDKFEPRWMPFFQADICHLHLGIHGTDLRDRNAVMVGADDHSALCRLEAGPERHPLTSAPAEGSVSATPVRWTSNIGSFYDLWLALGCAMHVVPDKK